MIQISVSQKGARADTVFQLVEASLKAKYPGAVIHVSRKEPAESRADRFNDAQSDVSSGKSEAESLLEELETWRDGLPENLQSGSKADELEDAISGLQEFIDACDSAEGVDVSFPSMY